MYKAKDLTILKDLNNQLKKIYSNYIITENNIIIGISEKFKISYYKGIIVDIFPELSNVIIDSEQLTLVLRKKKTEFDFIKSNNIIKIDDEDIGYYIDNIDYYDKIITKTMDDLKITDEYYYYEFSDIQISELISYKILKLKIIGDYKMYISISEFPLLKKLKKLTAYIKFSDTEYFDVIFKTYNSQESFYIFRKFLKL